MTALTPADFLGASRSLAAVPSAAYTAAPADVDIQGPANATGIAVTLDLTALTTAASVTVSVLGVDAASGKSYPIGAMATVTTVSTVTLRVHPNNPTAAVSVGVQTQQGQLPPRIRIHVVQGNTNSTTYSVGVDYTN